MGKLLHKFVKPGRPGLIVRDPSTKSILDTAGELKPYDSYWHRRLISGDAVECTPPKQPSKSKSHKHDTKAKAED